MRLIDADEAYKVLTDYYHHKTEIQHKALKEAIERVPTVDAESVVRCKDCKFYDANCPYPVCVYHEVNVKETDFCSWGERKEND